MRTFPLTLRLVVSALLLVCAFLTPVALWYAASNASPEGPLDVRAPGVKVRVLEGQNGVPHIIGQSDSDVFFGMGYLHARERMWQLEMQRRIARGRLSEVLGPSALNHDVWMRTLGLYDASRSAWASLSPEARGSLRAYAAGINAWLAEDPRLPPEFALLGVSPEPWNELDSLAWTKVFALSLSGNFSAEVDRYLLAQHLDRASLSTLFPYDDLAVEHPQATAQAESDGRASRTLFSLDLRRREVENGLGIGGRFVGSNTWVVSRALTKDGSAILANDPHLALQVPSPWFPVSQHGHRLRAQGMSMIGLPVVVFGRNEHIAWGGANLMADVQDLYFESFDNGDRRRYRSSTGWRIAQVRTEEILVRPPFPAWLRKPLAPVRLVVRTTERGPIISDSLDTVGEPVSLQWTALSRNDRSYESFLKLNYARDWEAFRDAFREYVAPALHMVYADRNGHIGSIAVGRIPLRSVGDGTMPLEGWNLEPNWKEFVPFDSMPQMYDPARGFIVAANSRLLDYPSAHLISKDWAPSSRADRIEELLLEVSNGGRPATIERSRGIQMDVVSLPARKLLRVLIGAEARDGQQRRALRVLAAWNGEMRADSVGASIFSAWVRRLRLRLLLPRLSEQWGVRRSRAHVERLLEETSLDVLYAALTHEDEHWCTTSRRVTGVRQSRPACEDVLIVSLADALNDLRKLQGSDMDSWRWGAIHENVYEHMPLSSINGISAVFGRRSAAGGSEDTVNASAATYREGEGFLGTHGVSFRQIIQLSATGTTHLFMNSSGQSGNPFSGRYSDTLRLFTDGQYYRFDSCIGLRGAPDGQRIGGSSSSRRGLPHGPC